MCIRDSHISVQILAALVVVINGMFLLVFLTSPKRRRSVKLLYVLLSLSDFLYGLFTLGVTSVSVTQAFDKQCKLLNALDSGGFAFCTMSLCSIAAISVEIYLAIMKPFTHATRRDKNTMAKILVGVWIICIVLPITSKYYLPNLWDSYAITCWIFIIFLLCFIMLVQTTVYLYVKRNPNMRSGDKHAFVTTVIFTCTYFLSFMPIAIIGIYSKFTSHRAFLESYVMPWTKVMTGFNCVTDPIVCVMRTAKWKELLFQKSLKRTNTNTVESQL